MDKSDLVKRIVSELAELTGNDESKLLRRDQPISVTITRDDISRLGITGVVLDYDVADIAELIKNEGYEVIVDGDSKTITVNAGNDSFFNPRTNYVLGTF